MSWWDELLANPAITQKLPEATLQTLGMIGLSGLGTLALGLPLGLLLYAVGPGGLAPRRTLYSVLSGLTNVGRSIPFIILAIVLFPVTRFVVGTPLGWKAASFPLIIAAVPFFARLVETAAREVAGGTIEAALMLGASRFGIIARVVTREALPSIVAGFTTTLIALVGYSAMAGGIGGEGLGFLAITYGYQRFDTATMLVTLVVIVLIVAVLQFLGDRIARWVDHR